MRYLLPLDAYPECVLLWMMRTGEASLHWLLCSCFFVEWYTLRQMMKVPNNPGLSPNNGLENAVLSDQSMASDPRNPQWTNPRMGQAERFGAKTTSHDGKAGHVMTHK